VLCGPQRVRDLYVEGRAVVREGQISRLDMPVIAEQARALAAGLA